MTDQDLLAAIRKRDEQIDTLLARLALANEDLSMAGDALAQAISDFCLGHYTEGKRRAREALAALCMNREP